ncbi:putative nuclease HARBI1 [Centroberyx affinis]|uniref:putative nuclease HARBI1 n=1 Tax=Centroberyx affinis TaxID=166261 RepID=UPI003A5C07D6
MSQEDDCCCRFWTTDLVDSEWYAQINIYVILCTFFSEADLKPAFRLSRDTINVLVQMLPRQKPHGWNHEIEVAVCLYWLACGTSYRVTADIFTIPRATVGRIVHSLVEEMMASLHKIIHFPKPEELEEVGAGFARLAGHEAFRCAAGAIDGCHIRILPPAEPQKKCYINRKLFPSVVLQGVCDSKGKFLDTYIGNTGSVHDALVLRRSTMYKESFYPPAGFFLLGDGGYPCLQHPVSLMTPYRQPVAGQVEARFNKHHAKARNIVERTFGMLKTRWRAIFLRALEIRPLFAPKVLAACCVLHNLCLSTGDILEEDEEPHEEDEEDRGNVPDDDDQELSGNNLRARLAAQVSAPGELPACLREHDYN